VGGGGRCLLCRRVEAAAGAAVAAAAAEVVPGAGIPGARTTPVVCGGLGKQERRRRQRAYLGVDEARGHGLAAAASFIFFFSLYCI
jgi:hypothetical protein